MIGVGQVIQTWELAQCYTYTATNDCWVYFKIREYGGSPTFNIDGNVIVGPWGLGDGCFTYPLKKGQTCNMDTPGNSGPRNGILAIYDITV